MSSSGLSNWALNLMMCPCKRKAGGDLRHKRKEGHVKMEAEPRVMPLQAKECLEPPKLPKAKTDSPLEPLEGVWLPPKSSWFLASLTMRDYVLIVFKPHVHGHLL